jgi:hypothetical protein
MTLRHLRAKFTCFIHEHDFVVVHNKWVFSARLSCQRCGKVEIVPVIQSISREDIQSKRVGRVGTAPTVAP